MGCSETIEEVNERNLSFQCGKMCYCSKVHNFLYGVCSEHSKTGLSCSHNVCMVAENAQSMCSKGSCGYVEYAGHELAGDLVHIRDHKKETLRSCECACESTCSEGTVYCTCSTAFRLHFCNSHRLPENVLSAVSSPFIAGFCHRGRRSDRVDRADIGKSIRNMSRSCISINRLFD